MPPSPSPSAECAAGLTPTQTRRTRRRRQVRAARTRHHDRDDAHPAASPGAHSPRRSPRGPSTVVVALVAVAGVLLLGPFAGAAHAGEVVAQAESVGQVLSNIRTWLMGILAGLATVFFTVGGVRYLMAGGDPGEVEKAKTAFRAAGIGYGLAALAPLVVRILQGIVGA